MDLFLFNLLNYLPHYHVKLVSRKYMNNENGKLTFSEKFTSSGSYDRFLTLNDNLHTFLYCKCWRHVLFGKCQGPFLFKNACIFSWLYDKCFSQGYTSAIQSIYLTVFEYMYLNMMWYGPVCLNSNVSNNMHALFKQGLPPEFSICNVHRHLHSEKCVHKLKLFYTCFLPRRYLCHPATVIFNNWIYGP